MRRENGRQKGRQNGQQKLRLSMTKRWFLSVFSYGYVFVLLFVFDILNFCRPRCASSAGPFLPWTAAVFAGHFVGLRGQGQLASKLLLPLLMHRQRGEAMPPTQPQPLTFHHNPVLDLSHHYYYTTTTTITPPPTWGTRGWAVPTPHPSRPPNRGRANEKYGSIGRLEKHGSTALVWRVEKRWCR